MVDISTERVTKLAEHFRKVVVPYEGFDAEGVADILEGLAASRDRLAKLDVEAATHVEGVVAMWDRFTGEPPYIGWKGIGLAIIEEIESLSTQLAAALKRAEKAERERDAFMVSNGELTSEVIRLRSDLAVAQAVIAELSAAIGPCGCVGGCEQAPQSGPVFYGRLCTAYGAMRLRDPAPPPPPPEPTS